MRARLAASLTVVAAVGCLCAVRAGDRPSAEPAGLPTPAAGRPSPAGAGYGPVQAEMRNVDFRFGDGIRISIRTLRGALVPAKPGSLPAFDQKDSFRLRIDSGEIAIGTDALSALMNEHVLKYRKAPLKDVEIGVDEGRLTQEGKLDKGIDIPFRTEGSVGVTPDGRIRVHAKSIKAAGLPWACSGWRWTTS